jgi:hypothetical protein
LRKPGTLAAKDAAQTQKVAIMANAVTDSVSMLERRLAELDSERDQILVALRALQGISNAGAARTATRGRQTRTRQPAARAATRGTRTSTRSRTARSRTTGSRATRTRTTRTSRRGGGGTQADRFLGLVRDTPGITVAQAAGKMGMARPNALYSVASRLAKEGKVTKRGTGYHVA